MIKHNINPSVNVNIPNIDLNPIHHELNEIFKTTYSYFSDDIDEPLSLKSYNEFKEMLSESIKTFYPHLSYLTEQLDDILDLKYYVVGINFDKIQKKISTIDFNKEFKTCEERDEFYDRYRNDPQVINKATLSKNQLKLFNQYEYLINLPQPAQKSKEWFDKRNGMLTASNGGAAIGESHLLADERWLWNLVSWEFKSERPHRHKLPHPLDLHLGPALLVTCDTYS